MAFTTEAYAVFDSADGSLVFFRDESGKYTNGQIIDTKTYYTGIETRSEMSTANAPWYSKRTSVQSVTFEDIIQPISTAYWFMGMNNTNFTSITGLDKLDTSNVTNMSYMFHYCLRLTTLDVSHFDTSNVTNMGYMFNRCENLISLDVSHFDTSNVTRMDSMFDNCYNLTTTLNIMNMPTYYTSMCNRAASSSGQLTLKYISPVTSANIDTLVATKNNGNVVNGGEGTFVPPISPGDEYKYLPKPLFNPMLTKIKTYIDSTIDAKIAELLQTLNQ